MRERKNEKSRQVLKSILCPGDNLLCGGSLREVRKDGSECTSTYESHNRHEALMDLFKEKKKSKMEETET